MQRCFQSKYRIAGYFRRVFNFGSFEWRSTCENINFTKIKNPQLNCVECEVSGKRVHIPVIITRIFWSKTWLAENKSMRNFSPPIIALFAETLFFENNPLYGIPIFPPNSAEGLHFSTFHYNNYW